MNPPDTQPLTMRARTPEDLLAMVPVLLGFIPSESVTMLTFGPRRMHARVDLPSVAAHVPDVVQALLRPCVKHGVERVALVLHSDQDELARTCARVAQHAFAAEGIDVAEALRADGRRWFPLRPDTAAGESGVSYDVSAHPFVAQAVLRGEIVFGSREQLAQSLDADPRRVVAVEWLLQGAGAPSSALTPRRLVEMAEDWLRSERDPSAAEIARLLPALAQPSVRDAAWQTLSREHAARQVALWTRVLVAAPSRFRAAPAAMVAFAAWLAGNGALAWCAVDLVDPATADQTIADVVRAVLEQAVPPSAWEEGRDRQVVDSPD